MRLAPSRWYHADALRAAPDPFFEECALLATSTPSAEAGAGARTALTAGGAGRYFFKSQPSRSAVARWHRRAG